jgi:hypothetical protein
MGARDDGSGLAAAGRIFDADEVQGVLSGSFYTAKPAAPLPPEKPTHYKVICISMYTKDLAQLDALVDALKARGMTKASRSALIRAALDQVDLDKIPRGM